MRAQVTELACALPHVAHEDVGLTSLPSNALSFLRTPALGAGTNAIFLEGGGLPLLGCLAKPANGPMMVPPMVHPKFEAKQESRPNSR